MGSQGDGFIQFKDSDVNLFTDLISIKTMNSNANTLGVAFLKSSESRTLAYRNHDRDIAAFSDYIMRAQESCPRKTRCRPSKQGLVRHLVVSIPKRTSSSTLGINFKRDNTCPELIAFYDKTLGVEKIRRTKYCSLRQAKSHQESKNDCQRKPFLSYCHPVPISMATRSEPK